MPKVSAYGRNPHGVHNDGHENAIWGIYPRPWSSFCYNWLGAKVKIKLFGIWREGQVEGVDDLHHRITVGLRDGRKWVTVTCAFQAARMIRES